MPRHRSRDGVVHQEREGEGGVAAAELLEDGHPLGIGERGTAHGGRGEEPGESGGGDDGAGIAPLTLPAVDCRDHLLAREGGGPGLHGGG